MEDAHICSPNLTERAAFFGVYDGHGGMEVSRYISRHLSKVLLENESFKNGDYEKALKESYLKIDEMIITKDGKLELHQIDQEKTAAKPPNQNNPFEMLENMTRQIRDRQHMAEALGENEEKAEGTEEEYETYRYGYGSGATAVSALIILNQDRKEGDTELGKIYVANSGDSRCVMSRAGTVLELSHDHKPYDTVEYERIIAAGGSVENGRVKGDLNLSRAIGDLQYKQTKGKTPEEQMITSNPDITVTPLTKEDDFLIIGCDGIWDVKSSQQAVDFVVEKLAEGLSPTEVCHEMLTSCLAPTAAGVGTDNMTVQVIVFKK
eukprot:TRINITY_DN12914_c0_g1_i2.p1 TRINITY_DN12914_c0_g1~~TRINITY_DN12914_c0_g1_i2.p1  ORF type:complete len:364 (+),score=150.58 TRINITY_DN12914_c0_g1_i2:131-1093(+)